MRTMDPTLKAALLMNAAHAPLPAFRKLCGKYAPEDLRREELWDALNSTRASPTGIKLGHMAGGVSRTLFPLNVDRRSKA